MSKINISISVGENLILFFRDEDGRELVQGWVDGKLLLKEELEAVDKFFNRLVDSMASSDRRITREFITSVGSALTYMEEKDAKAEQRVPPRKRRKVHHPGPDEESWGIIGHH